MRLEAFDASRAVHMQRVLDFLRLPRPPRAAWRRMLSQPHANRRGGGRYERMLPGTRALLRDFYTEYNEQLATLMGEPSYLQWSRDGDAASEGGMAALNRTAAVGSHSAGSADASSSAGGWRARAREGRELRERRWWMGGRATEPSAAEVLRRNPACPGSRSRRHAACSLDVDFAATCEAVREEITARIDGFEGWRCPKSHPGRYSRAASESNGKIRGRRTTGAGAVPPGFGKSFTDAFGFVFTPFVRHNEPLGHRDASTPPACHVQACSESQGGSLCDYSTNYCNLRNLYCGAADGCHVAKHELHVLREEPSAACFHAERCPGSLKGMEVNSSLCRR